MWLVGLASLSLASVVPALAGAAVVSTGPTELVSVGTGGVAGNDASYAGSISADGRYVAFTSCASDIVADDTNDRCDVFVRDRTAGTTDRVSVSGAGAQADGQSEGPSISADGRFVAFESGATNLVASDTNGAEDIFVRDRTANTTVRVSVSTGAAEGNSHSRTPKISPDGRYVAFTSFASNLVPGDGNNKGDVFVHDLATPTTERVNLGPGDGEAAGGDSFADAISRDGHVVLFTSYATNLVDGDTNATEDQFVRDRTVGTTERVSVSSTGTQADGFAGGGAISDDGRFVAFLSAASTLDAADTRAQDDVFVRDRSLGTTRLVSVSSSGAQADGQSAGPVGISADGRSVAFVASATNLLGPGLTDPNPNVWVRDLQQGTTELASIGNGVNCPCHAVDGAAGADEELVAISADGRFVAFTSSVKLSVAGNTNEFDDAFVHDRQAPPIVDSDGDGVTDPIDAGAGAFNDGAGTSGAITAAAGNAVLVEDAPAPDGVHITVSGSGSAKSVFSVCGFATLQLAPGSDVVVTCGSVTVRVTSGSADIVLDGGITVVTVPHGDTAKVTDLGNGRFTVANLAGSAAVSVTTNGTFSTVTSGATSTIAVLTLSNLCGLTKTDIQTSAKYNALSAKQKQAVDTKIQAACNQLAQITPKLTAKQKAALVTKYKAAITDLASQGWLTQAQAATLTALAGQL